MPLTPIPLSDLQKIGAGITRPEGVAVGRDGRVWASDQGSACAMIARDGAPKRVGQAAGAPNGITFDLKDRMVIANFGLHDRAPGPLQRLDLTNGKIETLCAEIGGRTLSTSNFPVVTKDGSIYCTHSSWAQSITTSLSAGQGDGFIYRIDPAGRASVVAEGLKFPNGCCLDASGKALYVVQTTGGNVLRFDIAADGSLRPSKPYGPALGVIPDKPSFGDIEVRLRSRFGYADGCAFDQEGNLWVALFMANRIVALTPSLQVKLVIDDPEGKILRMPTNIAWGGPDMRDLYIGSLIADYVVKTRSPVPGLPLTHQR